MRNEWIDPAQSTGPIEFAGEPVQMPDPFRVVDERDPAITRVEYKTESPRGVLADYREWFASRLIEPVETERGEGNLTITKLTAEAEGETLSIEVRSWEKVLTFTHPPLASR